CSNNRSCCRNRDCFNSSMRRDSYRISRSNNRSRNRNRNTSNIRLSSKGPSNENGASSITRTKRVRNVMATDLIIDMLEREQEDRQAAAIGFSGVRPANTHWMIRRTVTPESFPAVPDAWRATRLR
ncbi:hypothetical protein, partial [Pseudomonas batumici]|uniref:hypothetical protein n=1 Tax=Pseudomonas batumici TaxID=226910 RepID=UPI001AE039CF